MLCWGEKKKWNVARNIYLYMYASLEQTFRDSSWRNGKVRLFAASHQYHRHWSSFCSGTSETFILGMSHRLYNWIFSLDSRYRLDVPEVESRWRRHFSVSVQSSLLPHPASCAMCTWSFPRAKRSGRDHPLSSSARVANGFKLHLHYPSVPA